MKKLPDEKTLLEILELARDFEQSAREMCEMSTAIAYKYQKQVSEIRQAAAQKQETQASHFSTRDH